MLAACNEDGGGDEGQAGQLGQPCLGGTFCNEGLVCSVGTCIGEGNDEADEVDDSTGNTTDGDSTGDGDSSTTGPVLFELYEGACAATDECPNGSWCAESYWFCALDCTVDADCPTHPGATAIPQCTATFGEVDTFSTSKWGCALECEDSSECPEGTQCWAVGSSNWCGY